MVSTGFSDYNDYINALSILEINRLKQYYIKYIKDNNTSAHLSSSADEVSKLIETKLNRSSLIFSNPDINALEKIFDERCNITENKIYDFPIERALNVLKLSSFCRTDLFLTLQAAVDSDIRILLRTLQNDRINSYPTLEFCSKVYFSTQEGFKNNADLYNLALSDMDGLIILFPFLEECENIFDEQLAPDSRLVSLLCNDFDTYPPFLEYFYSQEANLDPIMFRENMLEKIGKIYNSEKRIKCILLGEKGSGKKHLVRHFSLKNRSDSLFLNLGFFQSSEEKLCQNLEDATSMAVREGIIENIPIAIFGFDDFPEEVTKGYLLSLERIIGKYPVNIFLLSEKEDLQTFSDNWYTLKIGELNEEQRNKIWEHYSMGCCFGTDVTMTSVANTFILSPGQIKSAITSAKIASNGESMITKETLYKCCYLQTDHSLSQKAKKVKVGFTWDDLKLPSYDKEILRDICNRVKNKHIVLNQWGFDKLLPYGSGLSVVFAGPPGTGKTMAAQVIAGELGMELYQIDLSQVVDKYIGETEKNIRMIFKEASKSNSILFFDEADSLFSKRIQNSSGNNGSNDRFANIESSLLLQCVESYSGISILATNHYSSIDPAFIRRFKYLINFRLPSKEIRLEMWKSMIPPKAPLDEDVDLKFYADTFEISGAYIKNIILYAAFLAAEENSSISDIHFLKGISRELVKEGRQLEQSQLGKLSYLFKEI